MEIVATQATQDAVHGTEGSDEEEVARPKAWARLFSVRADYPSIELVGDTRYLLGRHATCNFAFNDPVISNKHCCIFREKIGHSFGDHNDYSVFLEDLSTNGTFINDDKVGKNKRVALNHGDRIALSLKKKSAPCFLFHDCFRKPDFTQSKTPLHSYYNIIRPLGSGACGEVWLARHKQTGIQYAAKVIQKRRFNSTGNPAPSTREVIEEVNILRQLHHPNVIGVHEMFDTEETLYIVLELASGGELFDRILDKKRFSEQETKFFFLQLLHAVKYLHQHGVVHRDLKPENILLDNNTMEAVVKVTDFGLAKLVGPQSFMKTMCGTPDYLAPEVLIMGIGNFSQSQEGYGPAVDMWSLGVILFICLSGTPPFSSDITWHHHSLSEQILGAIYNFPEEDWRGVSEQARDLIRKLLVVNPKQRFNVDDCLSHPWMKDEEVIAQVDRIIQQHNQEDRPQTPTISVPDRTPPLLSTGASDAMAHIQIATPVQPTEGIFKHKRKKQE